MDPIEQRIAIAEACGWEKIYKGPEPDNRMLSPDGYYSSTAYLPDYLNDLNAMHAAKRALLTTFELCNTFQGFMLSERPHPHEFQTDKWTWGQSAEVEAVSLLKTLNLWTEE